MLIPDQPVWEEVDQEAKTNSANAIEDTSNGTNQAEQIVPVVKLIQSKGLVETRDPLGNQNHSKSSQPQDVKLWHLQNLLNTLCRRCFGRVLNASLVLISSLRVLL